MKPLFNTGRWVSRLALVSFALAALSPAAQAGLGSRRYKDVPAYDPPPAARHVHYAPQRVVYLERHSDAAPLFAGLIGGIVLGSILSQSRAPASVEPAYYYWDPWSHERYAALPGYGSRCYYRQHPRVLRVVSVETGQCVDTVRWCDGGWRSVHDSDHDGDWDHDGDRD